MPKKILLVDDDPDLVNAVSMILESKNYKVAAPMRCGGTREGQDRKPDLIVLDVMMPDKDGYVVCKELKSDPQLSPIPVLLLTAVVSHIPTTRYSHKMGLRPRRMTIWINCRASELVNRIETLLSK